MEDRPDYVPPRWTRGHAGRLARWLTARPERMLGWWIFAASVLATGVVAMLVLDPPYLGAPLVLLGVLNLAPDVRFIPRAMAGVRRRR